ncbi:uncharacterized protein LOC114123866 [Aphis gossypii]|uniref:uncharacterized protein LOC114123866 n=1 Tax=Aphis gossypii TaxID=80765 RepID=UPI002159A26C|nr:uncharacterized protein LOC114123866 [Aphis gossypii]
MAEQLIELVRKYTFLYDTNNKNYKNIGLKDETWKNIANELNENGINKQPAVPTAAPAAPLVPTIPEAINGNMFEDSDDELCVQLLNEVENTELCKNDNNIMFEDSDDELCVQLLEEVENSELCKTNAKQQDMLEIAPNIFVENNPAETSNKSKRVHVGTTVGTKEKRKKAKLIEPATETSLLESNLFSIFNKKNRFIKKYNAYMIDYSITLKPVPGN